MQLKLKKKVSSSSSGRTCGSSRRSSSGFRYASSIIGWNDH